MKTLGRILIILAAFALVMSVIYVAVNAGTSANASQFDRGFDRDGDRPAFAEGQRPEFPGGERHERGGGRWMFSAIKNIGIIAIVVTLIVLPKGWLGKRRKAAQFAS